ncbi:MAG: acyl-protein synthetase [Longimicrobiales bacterium]
MPESAAALRARLTEIFQHPVDVPMRDDAFDISARHTFEYQFEHNAPYAAYCVRRGITPAHIAHWAEIPTVPTAAFKEVSLVAGDAQSAALVFRTSGTTLGTQRRGEHRVRDATVYEEALLPLFSAYVLPDAARLAFVSLIPSAEQAPDSSLSYMVTQAATHCAGSNAGSFMDVRTGLDEAGLERTLAALIDGQTPVLLLGTSWAFVHWLDSLRARRQRFALPDGSRVMDTGGYKGRSRSVPEAELRKAYEDCLNVPGHACINEYGMTELCSQFYDASWREHVLGRAAPTRRTKRSAPWVRTRAVHPETLQPVAEGEVGILQHFDLANLFSVLAVQTEDLGRVGPEGIELLGRATGAVPRGCSIALDLLLDAVAGRA